MATQKKNIIVGAASVHLANHWESDGTTAITRPSFATGTSYRTTVEAAANWKDVGFTQEGLELAYEPDYGEVEVDQLLDAAKMFKQAMTVSLNTTFAEATLENLVIAWAQKDDSLKSGGTGFDGETLGVGDKQLGIEAGALGDAPVERQLIAVGNGVEKTGSNQYSERVYHAHRVLQVESNTHGLKRAEATTIPVSFRLLPNSAKSGAEYGTVTERLKS